MTRKRFPKTPQNRQTPRRATSKGRGAEQRRHARYDEELAVRLFRGKRAQGKRKTQVSFSAEVRSGNLSLGGIFLYSTFFLKRGLQLYIEVDLPDTGRTAIMRGSVARIIDGEDNECGFAIAFDEFVGDSEVYLRAYLDQGDIVTFVENHAGRLLPYIPKSQYLDLVEFLVHWQVQREHSADSSDFAAE